MNVFGSMAMNVFLNVVMILGIEAESLLMFKKPWFLLKSCQNVCMPFMKSTAAVKDGVLNSKHLQLWRMEHSLNIRKMTYYY